MGAEVRTWQIREGKHIAVRKKAPQFQSLISGGTIDVGPCPDEFPGIPLGE